MADGISFKVFTEPFMDAIAERERRMPRAAMWAVRQAGREVRAEARRVAPVLKGTGTLSHAKLQRYRRAGFNVAAAYNQPVPGLLRASIRASRNVKRIGPGAVSLTVGPRGQRVHLYAKKMEDRYGYMAAGERAGQAAIEVNAARAFDRVWRER
jgi:hypothetical protein